jgi:uncharacterized alkaline shock family protein YloU
MNIFNRAVVILHILLLVGLLIVAAVVPNTVLSRLLYTVQQAQATLQLYWPTSYVVFLAIAVLLVFGLIMLLWLEVRPSASNKVLIRNRDGTRTELSTSSLADSLRRSIDEIDDVFKVKSVVQGKRSGLDILLNLETTPEIDIPSKMQEVSQAARDLVERKMGLKVANLRVQVKNTPYGSAKATHPEQVTAPPVEPPSWSSVEAPTAEADNLDKPF